MTEEVNDRLADIGMEVVARESLDSLNLEKERYLKLSGAEEQELGAKIGMARGARFILSGRVDYIEPRSYSVFVVKHVEVRVHVKARLLDVEKGTLVSGCSFEVDGKKDRTGLNMDANLGNLFGQNDSAHRLYVEACKDAANKLVRQVVAKYPLIPKEQTRPFFARWSDEVDAATEKDARLQMLRRVTEALTESTVRTANAELLKKEFDDQCERYTEVEKVRDGRYKVSVFLSKPAGEGMDKALALPRRLQELHCLRQLKVIVAVPETHLAATRLPDPAGETKLREELQDMGFVLVDFDRAKELRDQLLERLGTNPHLDDSLLRSIQQQYPADILVWGEAISQRAEIRSAPGQISCNARVEVRAIWMKDGRVLGQGSAHAGGIEASEAIAAKRALLNAGGQVAPHLGQNMFCNAYVLPLTPSVPGKEAPKGNGNAPEADGSLTLIVTGCDGAFERQIEKTLKAIPGIASVENLTFKDNIATYELKGEVKLLKHLSDRLDDDDNLKKYNLELVSKEAGVVTWRVKPADPKTSTSKKD